MTYAGPADVPAIAFGPGGKLYVADAVSGRVVTPAGAEAAADFAVALDPNVPGRR